MRMLYVIYNIYYIKISNLLYRNVALTENQNIKQITNLASF